MFHINSRKGIYRGKERTNIQSNYQAMGIKTNKQTKKTAEVPLNTSPYRG